MTNLELANIVLANVKVNFEFQYSSSEKVKDAEIERLTDILEEEGTFDEIFEEEVELSEVDDFNNYIVANLRAQNEILYTTIYESISLVITLK